MPASVFLSLDDGATESLIADSLGGLDSNVVAVVAPDVLTNAARIRVAPADGLVPGSDRSDAPFTIQSEVDVSDRVIGFRFRPPWPNPARGEVQLSFELERAVDVTATVHDISGREVARPIAHERLSGHVVRTWAPADQPSGVYFIRASLGNHDQVRRLVWLRER